MDQVKMPPGKYYIGDLCYVMHKEWDEACELFFDGRDDHGCNQGAFKLADGREFANFNTKYGDGFYYVGGCSFGVDSGSIGCIKVEDIREELPEDAFVMTFDRDFWCYRDDGVLHFGHIAIDTDPDEEEEEDYDYSDEEEEA